MMDANEGENAVENVSFNELYCIGILNLVCLTTVLFPLPHD